MNTPNTGIPYVPEGTLDPAAGLNLALNVIDALLQCAVINMTTTAPPTATDGDLYIVATPATGEWAGHENDLARYVGEGDFWQFYTAGSAVQLIVNRDDNGLYSFDSSSSPGSWVPAVAAAASNITVQDTDSPPSEVVSDLTFLLIGANLVLTDLGGGVAQLEATGGGGGGGASNITPDTHPASPDSMDDEFEAGSLDGKWTGLNSPTTNFADGCLVLNDSSSTSDNLAGIEQTVSGSFKIRAKIARSNATVDNRGGVYCGVSGGAFYGFGIYCDASGLRFYINRFANATSLTSNLLLGANGGPGSLTQVGGLWWYFEIEYNGTTIFFRVSFTGVEGSYVELSSEAAATFLGGAPTRVGIYADRGSATPGVVLCDWFRRLA